MALSAAAGPASNILVAVLSMLLLKYLIIPIGIFSPEWFDKQVIEPIGLMLQASVIVNTVLAVFNMFPVPPLDGGRVVAGFLPPRYAQIYDRLEPFGMIIVLMLVVTGLTSYFIYPLVKIVLGLLKML
jgi:Zn-dependent protease